MDQVLTCTKRAYMFGFAFQLEETSNIAVISDKKLFVKAEFSSTAIEQFKRSVAMNVFC